jgi:hypothetical protein
MLISFSLPVVFGEAITKWGADRNGTLTVNIVIVGSRANRTSCYKPGNGMAYITPDSMFRLSTESEDPHKLCDP